MEIQFTTQIFKEGRTFVAHTPELDVSSCGGTKEKALKNLKDSTEKGAKELQILKKIAEEKKNEEAWNLIQKSLEITDGAHEGAETGLARFPGKPKSKG